MSPALRARLTSPSLLLILATLMPLVTAIIGHQLGERGEAGMLIGIVLTVALCIAVVARPKVERHWYVLATLPVLFWVGSLLWFTLAVS